MSLPTHVPPAEGLHASAVESNAICMYNSLRFSKAPTNLQTSTDADASTTAIPRKGKLVTDPGAPSVPNAPNVVHSQSTAASHQLESEFLSTCMEFENQSSLKQFVLTNHTAITLFKWQQMQFEKLHLATPVLQRWIQGGWNGVPKVCIATKMLVRVEQGEQRTPEEIVYHSTYAYFERLGPEHERLRRYLAQLAYACVACRNEFWVQDSTKA